MHQDSLAADSLHDVQATSKDRVSTDMDLDRPVNEGRRALNEVHTFLRSLNKDAKKIAKESIELLKTEDSSPDR